MSGERETLNLTIDEGTIHLMVAAYRLGAQNAKARPPESFAMRCVQLITAETEEETTEALAGGSHDQ